jgi:hypothetical protein
VRKTQVDKEEQSERSPWGDRGKMRKTETIKVEGKKSGLSAFVRKIGFKRKESNKG